MNEIFNERWSPLTGATETASESQQESLCPLGKTPCSAFFFDSQGRLFVATRRNLPLKTHVDGRLPLNIEFEKF